jgi:hypothetical protein
LTASQLEAFISFWINCVCRSGVAKQKWKSRVGVFPENPGNAVRWWCKFEAINHIASSWPDMLPFLVELLEEDVSAANTRSMMDLIEQDSLRLEVQLALVLDFSPKFISATYFLEGDSELIFFAMDQLDSLRRHVDLILSGEMPNVQQLILQRDAGRLDYWKTYAFDCIRPAVEYFTNRVLGEEFETTLKICASARNLVPSHLKGRGLRLAAVPKIIDDMKSAVWRAEWDRTVLIDEFAEYLEFVNSSDVEFEIDSHHILAWWKNQDRWKNLQIVVLHFATFTVSSATVERCFSLLSNGFKKGDQHLEDHVETSVMLSYNCARRESEEKL